MRKVVFSNDSNSLVGMLTFEVTNLESSRDYDSIGPWSWYTHGVVTQGATNGGQVLGSGIGPGGNGQYLGLSVYYPRGRITPYIQRYNKNNDYVNFLDWSKSGNEKRLDEYKFNAQLILGLDTMYFISDSFNVSLGLAYCDILNPLYNPDVSSVTGLNNLYFTCGIGIRF